MFFRSTSALVGAALLGASTVAAQASIASDIASAETSFQAQGLIPSPIPDDDIDLTSALVLSFGGNNVTLGQAFTLPADTDTLASAPTFQLNIPSSEADEYDGDERFVVAIVDPGAAGNVLPGGNVTRHYLSFDNQVQNGVLVNTSAPITSYNAPGPAASTGAHRYLALVFEQGDDFEPTSDLNTPGTPLANWTLSQWIENSDVGDIVAMTYITVENTEAGTTSFSSTAAVPSATLEAAASSIASRLSSTASSATSGGSSASSSATSTASSGASSLVQTSMIGGMGFALALVAGAVTFLA